MPPHRPMAVVTTTTTASMAMVTRMAPVRADITVCHGTVVPSSWLSTPDYWRVMTWSMIAGAAKNVISLAPWRSGSAAPRHAPSRPINLIITVISHYQPPTRIQQQPPDSLEQPPEPSMVILPVHYLSIVPLCPKAIHLVITISVTVLRQCPRFNYLSPA